MKSVNFKNYRVQINQSSAINEPLCNPGKIKILQGKKKKFETKAL